MLRLRQFLCDRPMPAEPVSTAENKPLSILIVEDDPLMQLGLKHFLSAYPHLQIVGQVGDGYSGVKAALELKPDLVVMDIGLPQLDGISAVQQIKAALPKTLILMLTSHNTGQETLAALSSGADAYCIKGTNAERMLTAIATVQDGTIYLDPLIVQHVLDHLKLPSSTPPKSAHPLAHLTDREMEVLRLMVEGHTNPEIATLLYVSLSTVKTHIRSIMNKLAVDDRVQAAVVALRAGLV
jgi:two-component system, NarL family, response regulator LiaR